MARRRAEQNARCVRRRVGPLLGAAVAGGLIAASAPPFGWWPLAPLGIALVYLLLAERRPARRAALGAVVGATQFAIGIAFVASFTVAGYVALVTVEAGLVALCCVAVPGGRGRGVGLIGASVLLEAVRDRLPFGGMPIGGLALGQTGGPLLALARLGGPLALAGAAAAVGVGLGLLVERARSLPGRRALLGAALLGGIVAIDLVARGLPAGGPAVATLPAAAVQGGGARGLSGIAAPALEVFGSTLATAAGVGRLDGGIVLWPEDSVPLGTGFVGSAAERLLATVARRTDATLVVGVTSPAPDRRFHNELAVLAPNGRLVGRYEKQHPVPFGEVVPLRGLLEHVVSLAAVPKDMVVGRRAGEMRTPAGPLGLLISYETFFPSLARSAVRSGAQVLLVATNTASYASAQVPTEELAASRLAAVATGRALLQAATTGISAALSPSGEIRSRSGFGSAGVVRAVLGLRRGLTPYVRLGDLPMLLIGVAGVIGAWAAATRRRGRRAPAPMISAGVGGGLDRALGERVDV